MNETAHWISIEIFKVITILNYSFFKCSTIKASGRWMLITIGKIDLGRRKTEVRRGRCEDRRWERRGRK